MNFSSKLIHVESFDLDLLQLERLLPISKTVFYKYAAACFRRPLLTDSLGVGQRAEAMTPSSWTGVRAHRVLSELAELCESSDSAVRAHGMVLDGLAAAGSSLKDNNDQVLLPEGQQIINLNMSWCS